MSGLAAPLQEQAVTPCPNARVCSKCQQAFPYDAQHFPQLKGWCKECRRAYNIEYADRRYAQARAEREAEREQPAPPVPSERVCSKCHVCKPLDAQHFRPGKQYRYGLTNWCRLCLRVVNTENARKHAHNVNAKRREKRRSEPEWAQAADHRHREARQAREEAHRQAWRAQNQRLLDASPAEAAIALGRLMPGKDAAAYIGVTQERVTERIRDGEMVGVYQGRQWWVYTAQVVAWKARHKPRGPMISVKPVLSLDGAEPGTRSVHECLADPNALDPLQETLRHETAKTLLRWVRHELREEERDVLLLYADCDFEIEKVAATLHKPVARMQSLLAAVQQKARATFGQELLAA